METGWKEQDVTHRDQKVVVVVSVKDYEKLISTKSSFKEFLLNCPKSEIDFERQKDFPIKNPWVTK